MMDIRTSTSGAGRTGRRKWRGSKRRACGSIESAQDFRDAKLPSQAAIKCTSWFTLPRFRRPSHRVLKNPCCHEGQRDVWGGRAASASRPDQAVEKTQSAEGLRARGINPIADAAEGPRGCRGVRKEGERVLKELGRWWCVKILRKFIHGDVRVRGGSGGLRKRFI